MIDKEWAMLMARYNRWQNDNISVAGGKLSDESRQREQGAFFGSIHATVNHILWGDRVWMMHLAGWEDPGGNLDDSLQAIKDWNALCEERASVDEKIIDWVAAIEPKKFDVDLRWHSGGYKKTMISPKWVCLVHMFNHGTHHRGQVHTMLTREGVEPGWTDLVFMEGVTSMED